MATDGQPREIEIKLEADPGQASAVGAMLERWLGAPERTDRLVSHYFDTAAADLRAHGLTLRVRVTGAGFVQTVKRAGSGSGGLLSRDEWEVPVPFEAPDLDAARATPVGSVLAAADGPLAPAFRSEVERRLWTVRRLAGTVEVAADLGQVTTVGATEPLLEVELELKEGDPAAVLGLLAEVPAGAGLTVGVVTKSERGYRLLDGTGDGPFKAEPIALLPGMPPSRRCGSSCAPASGRSG